MKAISVIAAAGVAAGLLLTSAGAATKGGSISLVAYSTPKDAYAQLIPAFQKTKAGKGVSFTQSYGASGDQAQAVVNGLLARARRHDAREGAPRQPELEQEPVARDGHALGGRLRAPERQPEAHP